MKKVFSIVLLVLILIVLLFNIVSIFEFSFFGYRVFKVATGSMEPTLSINSIILVKQTDDLNVGDIITYRDSRGYTTHRIIEMNEDSIITKGDANNVTDTPITTESVIGKVLFYVNIFGFIVYFLQNPVVWILILLIGLLVLLLVPVKIPHLKKVDKKEKKDKKEAEIIQEIVDKIETTDEEVNNKKKKSKGKNRFSKYY